MYDPAQFKSCSSAAAFKHYRFVSQRFNQACFSDTGAQFAFWLLRGAEL